MIDISYFSIAERRCHDYGNLRKEWDWRDFGSRGLRVHPTIAEHIAGSLHLDRQVQSRGETGKGVWP